MKNIFDFLKDLEKNNNREWFQNHRKEYETAKTTFYNLVEKLVDAINYFDNSIADVDPKSCIFRINRDVRFSENKAPYKNNFGAFIAKGGRNSGNPGYYIHLQPGQSFLGGGIYMPPMPLLTSIRKHIYANPDELIQIINDSEFKNLFHSFMGDKLKSAPKGFDKDFEHLDLLKYTSYAVSKSEKDSFFLQGNAKEKIIDNFKKQFPLIQYLNRAVE